MSSKLKRDARAGAGRRLARHRRPRRARHRRRRRGRVRHHGPVRPGVHPGRRPGAAAAARPRGLPREGRQRRPGRERLGRPGRRRVRGPVRLMAGDRLETASSEDPRAGLEEAMYELKRVIVGQDAMLERLLVALLAGGHVLLEGVPGLAKTLTVKTLASVLGGSFRRVQFTPDLVPSDLVGTRVYRPDTRALRHRAGAGVRQLPARRRDQPRAREGAVGAARGDAGAPGDDRRRDAPAALALPRHGHPEPDRVGGDLSAARGAGRPVPVQAAGGLPDGRRGGRGGRPRDRRAGDRPRAPGRGRPRALPRGGAARVRGPRT